MYKKLQPIKRRKVFGVTVHSVEAKEQMHTAKCVVAGVISPYRVLTSLHKKMAKWQNDTKNWSHDDLDGELINRTYAVPTVTEGRFYM